MVFLSKDWSDNMYMDYWRCDTCNSSYVNSNNEFCRYCGSPETWETKMLISEIKERESFADGTAKYLVTDDEGLLEGQRTEGLNLTHEMVDRNSDIHDAVYEMLLVLLERDREEFEWDMGVIGAITDDIIASLWSNFKMRVRFPSVVTLEDGSQHFDEHEHEMPQ